MTDLQRVLTMLAGNSQPKRSDTQASVRVEVSSADLERADISQVLGKAFAQVSQLDPPKVAEPIELLWRIADQRRANAEKLS